MKVNITGIDSDEGTIVVFYGYVDITNQPVRVAVDHRLAQDIVNSLAAGEPTEAEVEPWQVIG